MCCFPLLSTLDSPPEPWWVTDPLHPLPSRRWCLQSSLLAECECVCTGCTPQLPPGKPMPTANPGSLSSPGHINQFLIMHWLLWQFIIYIMGSRSAAGCRLFTPLGIAGKGAVPVKAEYDLVNALQEAWDTPDDAEAGGELGAAESSLSQYSDRLGGAWWQKFAEVHSPTSQTPLTITDACFSVLSTPPN